MSKTTIKPKKNIEISKPELNVLILPPILYSVDREGPDLQKVLLASVKHKISMESQASDIQKQHISLSPRIVPFNPTELTVYADIDAIFGALTFSEFRKAFGNNNLIIKVSNFKISCKTEHVTIKGQPVNIASLMHIQIGSLNMNGDKMSVFYVAPAISVTSNREVILSYVKDMINNSKCIKTSNTKTVGNKIVYPYALPDFCNYMAQKASATRMHHQDFLFVESYGNKNSFVVNSISSPLPLLDMLSNHISLESFEHLKIDLAISIYATNSVVFPDYEFFKNMNIKPNYYLFFNKNLANSNQNMYTFNKDTQVLVFESEIIEKANFYSTVEDVLSSVRKREFIPEISYAVLKGDLAGNHQFQRSTTKFLG